MAQFWEDWGDVEPRTYWTLIDPYRNWRNHTGSATFVSNVIAEDPDSGPSPPIQQTGNILTFSASVAGRSYRFLPTEGAGDTILYALTRFNTGYAYSSGRSTNGISVRMGVGNIGYSARTIGGATVSQLQIYCDRSVIAESPIFLPNIHTTWFWVELRAIGNLITANVYDAETLELYDSLEVEDSTYTSGWCGVSNTHNNSLTRFAAFSVGTDGDSALLLPPGPVKSDFVFLAESITGWGDNKFTQQLGTAGVSGYTVDPPSLWMGHDVGIDLLRIATWTGKGSYVKGLGDQIDAVFAGRSYQHINSEAEFHAFWNSPTQNFGVRIFRGTQVRLIFNGDTVATIDGNFQSITENNKNLIPLMIRLRMTFDSSGENANLRADLWWSDEDYSTASTMSAVVPASSVTAGRMAFGHFKNASAPSRAALHGAWVHVGAGLSPYFQNSRRNSSLLILPW